MLNSAAALVLPSLRTVFFCKVVAVVPAHDEFPFNAKSLVMLSPRVVFFDAVMAICAIKLSRDSRCVHDAVHYILAWLGSRVKIKKHQWSLQEQQGMAI